MKYRRILSLIVVATVLSACGASLPPPTQRLADAQSAERSARELGANSEPTAQLSLKLADEQIALAQKAMSNGDNNRADSLLIRAKADAELAVVLAREKGANTAVQVAVDKADAQRNTNIDQGAVK
jgi:hypothetical protein